jgi:hypothetical protein
MRKLAIVLLVMCVCMGCGSKVAPLPVGSVSSDAVHDDDKYRNFVKVWTYQVTPEVQMSVRSSLQPWLSKCDWMGCGSRALSFSDELIQSDGKSVDFDCDDVADKIIDRDLVPKVEVACASVHATAIAYWKGNNDPSEFTDKDGHVWRRQP